MGEGSWIRRSARFRFACMGVMVALVAVAGLTGSATASHPQAPLLFGCALKSNGLVRYVTNVNQCRPKQETSFAVWPGPTHLCIKPDGSVRKVNSPADCGSGPPINRGTPLTIPSSTDAYFCAAASTGVLRYVTSPAQCTAGETALVVANHAPTDIALSNASVAENEPVGTTVGTLSATDPDPAATFTFSLVAGAGDTDNGSFTIAGTTLKTNAVFDFETKNSYSIRVRVTDGYGGSREEQFTITVTDVVEDIPPTAVDDSATVGEDSGANAIDVLANDSDGGDGGPVSVQSTSDPANGTVVITGGGSGLTYQPDANYCNTQPGGSPDTFTYTLNGGSTATVSVTVTCVDDPPTAVNDSATVNEDAAATAINVLANDTDIDGGPKSVASVTQPTNGTVVITGGGAGLTYQPAPNYCNDPPGTMPDVFTYTLNGGSTATVSVTVTCVVENPTAVDDTATVTEDSGANAIDVLANDTDPDNNASIQSASDPANGTVVITGGGTGLTYQPDAAYCNSQAGGSPDTFTYTLTPGGSIATVSVTVTCVVDNPTAVNDSATVLENAAATAIDVLANDTDPDNNAVHSVHERPGERHGRRHRWRHRLDLSAGSELLQRPAGDDARHLHLHAHSGRLDRDGLGDCDVCAERPGGRHLGRQHVLHRE